MQRALNAEKEMIERKDKEVCMAIVADTYVFLRAAIGGGGASAPD
jgi:hypothetical protein